MLWYWHVSTQWPICHDGPLINPPLMKGRDNRLIVHLVMVCMYVYIKMCSAVHTSIQMCMMIRSISKQECIAVSISRSPMWTMHFTQMLGLPLCQPHGLRSSGWPHRCASRHCRSRVKILRPPETSLFVFDRYGLIWVDMCSFISG